MEGVHSRVLTDGIELAKKECLKFLDDFRVPIKEMDKV
jgi:chaperonin GroEL (HSP60 family)